MTYAPFHDLKDSSVFITGGGSGIGAALTDGFMAQGAKVAFVQRSDATQFCDEMATKHGVRPLFIKCDVTDTPALQDAIAQSAETHGTITTLVNNAAYDMRHPTQGFSPEEWADMIAVNLSAHFFTAQAVTPGMIETGGGAIINFSSISYMLANDGYHAYASSKAGIIGLTRGLAREFGPHKIRVNALAPGWVLTERQMTEWASDEALKSHLEKQCLKEHLVEQDIVDATLFLASKTSRMMTGQTMVVDGGTAFTG